jgi:hypothetical protein
MYGTLLAEKLTNAIQNCHGIFGLSDYHQERTSPTYSQKKNNPRQLHPYPQKQLCPKCGCPEMKCFRGNLAFGGHISTRTVIGRLHHQGMRARQPMKRHRHA